MPVNSKSLFSYLCATMEKLDNNDIDIAQANAQAKIVAQAINVLNYELKRGLLMCNAEFQDHHRIIESKNFDSLTE